MFFILTFYVALSLYRGSEIITSLVFLCGAIDAINMFAFIMTLGVVFSTVYDKRIAYVSAIAKHLSSSKEK